MGSGANYGNLAGMGNPYGPGPLGTASSGKGGAFTPAQPAPANTQPYNVMGPQAAPTNSYPTGMSGPYGFSSPSRQPAYADMIGPSRSRGKGGPAMEPMEAPASTYYGGPLSGARRMFNPVALPSAPSYEADVLAGSNQMVAPPPMQRSRFATGAGYTQGDARYGNNRIQRTQDLIDSYVNRRRPVPARLQRRMEQLVRRQQMNQAAAPRTYSPYNQQLSQADMLQSGMGGLGALRGEFI